MKLDQKIIAVAIAASLCLGGQLFAQDAAKQNKAAAKNESPEHKFVREAAKGGMAEVKMGELAAQKAQSSSVKQFGDRLARDHQEANEKLKKIAERKNIDIPQELEQKDQKMIDHLSSLSGREFDNAFLKHALQHHQKDIKKFELQASEGDDPAIRSFASETLPVLREHQRIAQTLSNNPNASIPELREPAGAERESDDDSSKAEDDDNDNSADQSNTQP